MNFGTGERAWASSPVAPVDSVPPDPRPVNSTRVSGSDQAVTAPAASSPDYRAVDNAEPQAAAAPADGAPPGLSALLAQARAAQKQLADQPLPIANRNLPLIQKLFGG